jgi:glutamyl-tRNA synthetase
MTTISLKDLPDADGPYVTRCPPEPSGYMHIGHAKAALLNGYIAHHYKPGRKGNKLIVRFDDTDPSKEKQEFQDAILHDLHTLNIYEDEITHSSDRFQDMYDYAIQLIKDGKAFADDATLGKGNDQRKSRKPSDRRDMSIEDMLSHFEAMYSGSPDGQNWCLRARIDYGNYNDSLRDPVIYRCNDVPHHRTGTAWHIYPTYDFCVPILDALDGVTLACRTTEYRDRDAQYHWFQGALGLKCVPVSDFSRLNFVKTVLSKRHLSKIVQKGLVTGWDDPRIPTIRGILRRGLTIDALRDFIGSQGASKNVLLL